MKVHSAELLHPIIIPGLKVSGDYTLAPKTKHFGMKLSITDRFLQVSGGVRSVLIPMSNVKVITLEDE